MQYRVTWARGGTNVVDASSQSDACEILAEQIGSDRSADWQDIEAHETAASAAHRNPTLFGSNGG